jgi:anti-sigma factor RsiW
MKDFWNKIESQSFNSMEGEKMKCSHIRNMISQYVDDELAPDEKNLFTSHIQTCSACREELGEIQSVHQLFAPAERFEAPYGFETRVMAHLEEIEETGFWRLWRFVTGRRFFLRTIEVAFAMVVMLIGVISGDLLVADKTSRSQPTVQESFSLDLFRATPPDSIGGVYVKLMGASDER